jgi:hypothetical protein
MYIPLVKKKRSKGHICRAKFFMVFFTIVESLATIYNSILLPVFYVQLLRNENSDILPPKGSNLVPPLSAFFYECSFSTLPLMAWIIYSTIQNKHTRQGPKHKPRKNKKRKRANSFDSRRTLPQVDFIVQANEDL